MKKLRGKTGVSGIGQYSTPLSFMKSRNFEDSKVISKNLGESRSEKSATGKSHSPIGSPALKSLKAIADWR
jgi:hypothetical protein